MHKSKNNVLTSFFSIFLGLLIIFVGIVCFNIYMTRYIDVAIDNKRFEIINDINQQYDSLFYFMQQMEKLNIEYYDSVILIKKGDNGSYKEKIKHLNKGIETQNKKSSDSIKNKK